MRIAVAVVAGIVGIGVLVGSVSAGFAAETRRQRAEYCVDGCNLAFERCQAQKSSKDNSRCNIEAVKCKNDCPFETIEEPAVPTARSHQRCVDGCRDTYKKCLGRAENKRGGNCAADDVRCEQACPKPPAPEIADVPPAAPGAPATSGGAPVAAPAKKPKRAARVEGAAAPAPAAATPAAAVPERAVAAPPVERSMPVTPPAESAAAARPAPEERGFFATIGCFFRACDKAGSTPCLNQCATAYDECHVRESKRGGECNTRLMNCRKSCRDGALSTR